jgi:dTMP kinase|tara:strand:- start:1506 stop:2126 length:621 start_codon:yes stop_codon:yes gene_type:complete
MSGLFITVEGIECVGKSTNTKFISKYLNKKGIKTHTTREPGGTLFGEKIRNILLYKDNENLTPISELLLLFAARDANIEKVIKPALQDGKWVICDRFTDASFAYQGFGRQLGYETVASLKEIVHANFDPDITFLLDAPLNVIKSRRKLNANDRFESESDDFFNKVRNGYLEIADRFPDRVTVIDASKPIQNVQNQIVKYLKELVKK